MSSITIFYVGVNILLHVLFTIFVIIAGAFDLKSMLQELKRHVPNDEDDGRARRTTENIDSTSK